MVANQSEQPVIVHIDQAKYRVSFGGKQLSLGIDLAVRAGELVCVQVDRSRTMGAIGDACCGMILPDEGGARFGGRSWAEQYPQDLSAMRASIGRAGQGTAWLPFLSVADNVLLAQMHHTRRSVEELTDEAATLANELGLPGLPLDMPGNVGSGDLNRASIVRAFMGRPKLILLEKADVRDPELTPLLINRILVALGKGAAVIWVSESIPEVAYGELGPTTRYRLRASGELEKLS